MLDGMIQGTIARNPKLRGSESPQSGWYRYYAGFSEGFAKEALASVPVGRRDWVVDPWSGSGTTVSTALSLGMNVRGYDLNPVMVLVAKARCLEASECPSLRPLASEIIRQSRRSFQPEPGDPLSTWFHPSSVAAIRAIETGIHRLLIDDGKYTNLKQRGVNEVSDLAAFFYVAVFRTIRQLLQPFLTSNPTWIKRPESRRSRLRPTCTVIRDVFRANLAEMIPRQPLQPYSQARGKKIIGVASSESLPLPNESVGCVLSSPPYCTRIDYAVATSPELAVLGYNLGSEFDMLRRQLIGTSTVPSGVPDAPSNLGKKCLTFLDTLFRHSSKASLTYYYKNHLQYFLSIGASLSEIRRILKAGGRCILVVQDSYYKNVHNDLPAIVSEMAAIRGLRMCCRSDFPLRRTMAGVNPGAREYRNSFSATESVLTFDAQPHKSN